MRVPVARSTVSPPLRPGMHAGAAAGDANGPGLGAKVAFLSQPGSYDESASRVEAVETHMSWVFLTDAHAWKLKKPVRSSDVDFATVAGRRRNCDEELRLNRRLSDDVYLEVVPLTLSEQERLHLGGSGRIVDWLLKMRRLPAERMLDCMIRAQSTTEEEVQRLIRRLAHFYRGAPPLPLTATQYRGGFDAGIAENRQELSVPAYGLPVERVVILCDQQRAWLASHHELLAERVIAGRVIEAHGDLRPEHICLEAEPQIIDCLEFSRALRTLDPADELAFLALECERLGAAPLGEGILARYTMETDDRPPPALVEFYRSYRACVRAKIAIRHLEDASPREPAKWVAQAQHYLQLADQHMRRAV